MSEAERLIAEGQAILDMIDATNAREEKERTMGSMALSSYCEDMYHRAMDKFNQACTLQLREEKDRLES